MKRPEPAARQHDELHILLPGQRFTVQQEERSAPKAPRRLRVAWFLLTMFFVLLALAAGPLVPFILWSLMALPLVVFSKYRLFPRPLWLRIPLVLAWPFLLLISVAMIAGYVGNPVAAKWEDQILLPPAVAVPGIFGAWLFPLFIGIRAQLARKKPGRH